MIRLAAICVIVSCITHAQVLLTKHQPVAAFAFAIDSAQKRFAFASPDVYEFTAASLQVSSVSTGGILRMTVQGIDTSTWAPDGNILAESSLNVSAPGTYTFSFGKRIERRNTYTAIVIDCYPYTGQNITITYGAASYTTHFIPLKEWISYTTDGSTWNSYLYGWQNNYFGIILYDGSIPLNMRDSVSSYIQSVSGSLYYMAKCTSTMQFKIRGIGIYGDPLQLNSTQWIQLETQSRTITLTRPSGQIWRIAEVIDVGVGQEVTIKFNYPGGGTVLVATKINEVGPLACRWYSSSNGISWSPSSVQFATAIYGDYAPRTYIP